MTESNSINKAYLLDTDIGSDIDDSMALLLCLRIRNFPLVAITTVYNVPEIRAKIAKKMTILEEKEIPVGIGKQHPIDKRGFLWRTGLEGLGILNDEEFNKNPQDFNIREDGIDLILDMGKLYGGNLEILSIGQFSNVQGGFLRDPKLKNQIKKIWSMSAGVTFLDPIPEDFPQPKISYEAFPSHNIRTDVKAAKMVLDSGIPITFIGNDVTTGLLFKKENVPQIQKEGSILNYKVMDMMKIWLKYRSRRANFDMNCTCLHDPLVIAEAIGMNFTKRIPVDIEIKESGGTIINYNPSSIYDIAYEIDNNSFMNWYLNIITGDKDFQYNS